MYSAAPSALTEHVLHPHSHSSRHAGLEHAFDEMSLHSHPSRINGAGYADDDGLDEFREDEPPLGYGIEHACRCVAAALSICLPC